MTDEEATEFASQFGKWVFGITEASKQQTDLNAQTEFMASVIQADPGAFEKYQETVHYQRGKQCLESDASNVRKAMTLYEMAHACIYLSKIWQIMLETCIPDYETRLTSYQEELQRPPHNAMTDKELEARQNGDYDRWKAQHPEPLKWT